MSQDFDIVKKIEKGMDALGVKLDDLIKKINNLQKENLELKEENARLKNALGITTTVVPTEKVVTAFSENQNLKLMNGDFDGHK